MKTNLVEQKPQNKNYRVCYEGGNSATGKKIYELYKYCRCQGCSDRITYKRATNNKVTVTTKDISKVDEIAEFLRNWNCEDGQRELEISYFRF